MYKGALTPIRSSIWTDIPQSNDIFGLQPLDEAEESGALDLPSWK